MSYILTSILHCLKKRAAALGHPTSWDWVLGDPVVGVFAPALYLLDQDGLVALPDALRERVRGLYFQVAAQWVRRMAHLQPLLAQLDQAGIEVIPLKGAALLETHYKQVGLRPMADIDILVRPGDFLAAAEVLIAAGLKPSWHSTVGAPFGFKNLPRDFWPLELHLGDNRGFTLDLHQHLIAFHWFTIAFPCQIDSLWARRSTSPTWGANQMQGSSNLWRTMLSAEDMLAHLCLHPAFHGFRDIKSFLDVDIWIRHLPEDWDWSGFMSIAEAWGIRNCAYHALQFARCFFNAPVPGEVLAELDPGGLLRFQVSTLISAQAILEDRPTVGKRFQPLVLFALFDSPSRQLRTLINAIFPNRTWLRGHPEYRTLLGHWRFILRRLFRNGI